MGPSLAHHPRISDFAVPVLVIAALWSTVPCALGCTTRHFYNNSTGTFTAELDNGKCSINGLTVSKRTIPSGRVAELHFQDANSLRKGRIHVVGKVAVGDPATQPRSSLWTKHLACKAIRRPQS